MRSKKGLFECMGGRLTKCHTHKYHRIPVCTKGLPTCWFCWQTTNWSLYEGEKYPLLSFLNKELTVHRGAMNTYHLGAKI